MFKKKFKLIIILFYLRGCFAYMYVCVPHTCLIQQEAKKGGSNPLEFQTAVSYHVGGGK